MFPMEASLKGRKVAITSGPTRAWIDEVRFISNRSSGALGVAIANACLREGAEVTLFHGAGSLLPRPSPALRVIETETVLDLVSELIPRLQEYRYDVFFHAMAVLDYMPDDEFRGKIPSNKRTLTVRMSKTPKVINVIKKVSPETILVGFKLEVGVTKDELAERARKMMKSSKADFVFANDLRSFRMGQHAGYLLDREGCFQGPFEGKRKIAKVLVEAVKKKLSGAASAREA